METRGSRSSQQKVAGAKRKATTALDNEQRLTKRFDLLNLEGHNGKRYVPVATTSDSQPSISTQTAPPTSPVKDEFMQVDDTKDKVYIYDLDKELEDIESDEERPIFIPDIEKHMLKIPKHVLFGDPQEIAKNQQLVLYNVPSALSVPEEQDSVRKAIIDARARAREKASQEGVEQGGTTAPPSSPVQVYNGVNPGAGYQDVAVEDAEAGADADTMDID